MTLFEDLQSKPNVFRGRSRSPLLDFGGAQRKRVDEFLQASFRFKKTRHIGRIAISRCNRNCISRFESFEITPEDFGLKPATLENVRDNDAGKSAAIIGSIFSGGRRDEARDLVVINAAAALVVGGAAQDFGKATRLAEESIDSGAARSRLNELIRATNK